jgi:hypothetical protein
MSAAPYGTEVERCHGTLVAHLDGALDCTDPACALPDPLHHVLVIDCADVSGGCCIELGPEGFARAS